MVSKTKIDWATHSTNPIKGLCPVACGFCYARRMYKRFRWDETIRYDDSVWRGLEKITAGSRVFVGSTMELFHDNTKQYLPQIFEHCKTCPDVNFIFLTKCPQNLPKEFLPNCWIGVSTTGYDCRSGLEDTFRDIKAPVKFVSIEPLLDYSPMDFRWVDWVIIGAQTPYSKKTQPRFEWVVDILKDCNMLHKPVFLKNNLYDVFEDNYGFQFEDEELKSPFYPNGKWRQEFPHVGANQ